MLHILRDGAMEQKKEYQYSIIVCYYIVPHCPGCPTVHWWDNGDSK